MLGLAGVLSVLLALGHMSIGLSWVLPRLAEERLPSTRFGPPATTLGLIRVTWHIVTLFVLAFAAILLTLAWDGAVDPLGLFLRSFAAMWFSAAVMALWVARRNPRRFLRRPVWLVWLVVSALCWAAASTLSP